MKSYLLLVFATILFVVACGTSKKSTTSSAPATNPIVSSATTPTNTSTPSSTLTSSNMFMIPKVSDGMYAPGVEELTAIQIRYKDATMEQLKEGHSIYTVGACIQCHGTTNIYTRSESQWKDILDDMAYKARLSEAQKDAVVKYVLAIKANQPK